MGLFSRNAATEPDLSDEALFSPEEAEAEPEEGTLAEGGEEPTSEFAADGSEDAGDPAAEEGRRLIPRDDAEQEQVWQSAVQESLRHWPQIRQDMRRVVAKMAELSARTGDATLWQRAPGAMMREAAVELYGMPEPARPGVMARAVAEAHRFGMEAAARQARAKAGLAPPQVSRSAPPPLTEEERIIQEMMASRSASIF